MKHIIFTAYVLVSLSAIFYQSKELSGIQDYKVGYANGYETGIREGVNFVGTAKIINGPINCNEAFSNSNVVILTPNPAVISFDGGENISITDINIEMF